MSFGSRSIAKRDLGLLVCLKIQFGKTNHEAERGFGLACCVEFVSRFNASIFVYIYILFFMELFGVFGGVVNSV